jgi:hypothetical protein
MGCRALESIDRVGYKASFAMRSWAIGVLFDDFLHQIYKVLMSAASDAAGGELDVKVADPGTERAALLRQP